MKRKNAGDLFEEYLLKLAEYDMAVETEEEKDAALVEFMRMFFFREVMQAEESRVLNEKMKAILNE